ncbi:site-specific DNA-methyltransferase [Accumulibacter sp.]|uniref:site-specific DNA-methyltransferase n=1 Tax=Accumulibacter sp. TaxID=2053492 RepID=UPI002586D263|nr:site-specific DNA-methyltransferase [Accumulibacter sp.]
MSKKQKLELTWIGKENQPKLEPRILLEEPAKSYHAKHLVTSADFFDNRLIFGDNLLALKALEGEFSGKVKCVFIDPPYNTGSAFTHYDDGVEHSIWLSLMRDRLEIIKRLLSDDGSLWITIDDNEAHYLKVLCDEVFGRANFVANVVWQKAYTSNQTAMHISNTHDHVLVYAKNAGVFQIGKVPRTDEQKKTFSNPDNDPRGDWKAENLSAGKFYAAGQFPIIGPKGDEFLAPKGRYWRCNQQQYEAWLRDGRITFGRSGEGRPMLKKFLAEMQDGLTANTWWVHEEVGSNKEASIDLKRMFGDRDDVFQNPKPEKLIQRILTLATNPGDIVLDSFAGSGTTGAVAHKMGRRWIMVELGEHCHTHIIPRLKKVIDGEDQGGISKAVNWKGGGGFRYYRLAPSLLEKDKWGNWVINHDYNAAMLAEALCKLEGFSYAPSDAVYWQHGHSTERDFVYVTTASLTHEQLQQLSDEVGPDRSLLVLCTAFRAKADAYPNLTVKKIPRQVLSRCEWGHDDYSLQVENLPKEPPKPGQQSLFDGDEP